MCRKRILVLGAGLYYINVINKIKEIDYEVHVIDKNPKAPGFDYADKYAVIDIFDRIAVYHYAKENNINGIMPINDFGTRSAFYASQKLNLISPPLLSGICANDKGIMRDIWSQQKLLQPKYFVFSDSDDIELIEKRIKFPLIIKPTDAGGGGRGISAANNKQELREAITHAKPFVNNNRYIAEEVIEGMEITVDSFVYNGEVIPILISDKEKPISRYKVATSLNFPAKLTDKVLQEVKKIVIEASFAMGIVNGYTHTELIYNNTDNSIFLIEMGARGGGGHLFSTITEEVTGISAPQELSRILCGEHPTIVQKKESGCVYRFFNPKTNGIFKKLVFSNDILNNKFVIDFGVTIKKGDLFSGLTDSMKRIGYVITRGENREDAIRNADFFESNLSFFFE